MADEPEPLGTEELRRKVAEISRQLSELDVMLADYQKERARLIRELRALQARLRDLLEQAASESEQRNEKEQT